MTNGSEKRTVGEPGKTCERPVEVRVKRLQSAPSFSLPDYETEGSSGVDIRAAVEEDVIL